MARPSAKSYIRAAGRTEPVTSSPIRCSTCSPSPPLRLLGLGKGGFAGIGMISTPLLALVVPPLQAAAILLPILLLQDMLSCWVYRRDWSAWNLKVLLPGAVVGVAAGLAVRRLRAERLCRLAVGVIGIVFVL